MPRIAAPGIIVRGSVGQATNFVDPVINQTTTTPPGSPTAGDRYIIASVATGEWVGREGEIAEWNGASWDYTTPTPGMMV